MRIILLRHGETSWNATHRMQGQEDIPLNEIGRAQASAVGTVLRWFEPDLVQSSDLSRARDTAALAGFDGAFQYAHWREMHMGEWQGQLSTDVAPEARAAWVRGERAAPGGETLNQFVGRVRSALNAIPRHHSRVVVACHGLVVKAALVALFGVEYRQIGSVRNCSVTEIDWSNAEDPKLARFNEVTWTLGK